MPNFLVYLFIIVIGVLFGGSSRRSMFGYSRYDDYYYGEAPINNIFAWVSNKIHKRNRRIAALKTAANYLKPYEKIFGSLTLSNKFCSLNRNKAGDTIICISKEYDQNGKCMMLTAKRFSPIDVDEYFDMMCEMFNYSTRYSDIHKSLLANAIVTESVYSSKPVEQQSYVKPENPKSQVAKKYEQAAEGQETQKLNKEIKNFVKLTDGLTDVNNASEAELTALSGINIVMAKKIINYRDTVRPFKSVDDFIEVMNIKPHFAKRLKAEICVNKVNMKKVKKARAERIIDL